MAFHVYRGALKQLAITPKLANQHQRSKNYLICTCQVPFKGKIIRKPLLIERMPLWAAARGISSLSDGSCGWFGVSLPMERAFLSWSSTALPTLAVKSLQHNLDSTPELQMYHSHANKLGLGIAIRPLFKIVLGKKREWGGRRRSELVGFPRN